MATAFHRNTMTNVEGGTDDEEFRVAAVKDRVNVTMQAWMGLTMGCAQCHTHKFDPITQREYYQFMAFFNQTEDNDQPDESPLLALPKKEEREKMEKLKNEIASLPKKLPRYTAAAANVPRIKATNVETTATRTDNVRAAQRSERWSATPNHFVVRPGNGKLYVASSVVKA